jgi:hypothetical protein
MHHVADPQHAVPVARALVEGGVGIIELTLRTDSALESLKRIANEVPDILWAPAPSSLRRRPTTPSPRAPRSWSVPV